MTSQKILNNLLYKALHEQKLGEKASRLVFQDAIKLYSQKEITLDDLEFVALQLYYELNNPAEIESSWNKQLASLIRQTSDITYLDTKKIIKQFDQFQN